MVSGGGRSLSRQEHPEVPPCCLEDDIWIRHNCWIPLPTLLPFPAQNAPLPSQISLLSVSMEPRDSVVMLAHLNVAT